MRRCQFWGLCCFIFNLNIFVFWPLGLYNHAWEHRSKIESLFVSLGLKTGSNWTFIPTLECSEPNFFSLQLEKGQFSFELVIKLESSCVYRSTCQNFCPEGAFLAFSLYNQPCRCPVHNSMDSRPRSVGGGGDNWPVVGMVGWCQGNWGGDQSLVNSVNHWSVPTLLR